MENLGPADVAQAIRDTLGGRLTKPQLGKWADCARLNALNGAIPYEWRYRVEIGDAIMTLMALSEMVDVGVYFDLSDGDLRAMVGTLEQLAQQ
jgi:hypothetical protein